MIRTAAACVMLVFAAAASAAGQQRARIVVAVPSAEVADISLKVAATRLTAALRATIKANGFFELYDTVLTRKSTVVAGDQRLALRLPTQYVCLSRLGLAIPGWAQATVSFTDASIKDPVVRFSSPVQLRSDSTFISFAQLAWDRLATAERKRLDSLRTRAP